MSGPLHFEGEHQFSEPPPQVWKKVSDARFLAKCVPGAESVVSADASQVVCVLRPGFSFVRGTLELTLKVVEATEPDSVRLRAHGKGIGSSNDVEVLLRLHPEGSGTKMQWSAEVVELGGLLKAVPQGLIKAAAQKVISDGWTALTKELSQTT